MSSKRGVPAALEKKGYTIQGGGVLPETVIPKGDQSGEKQPLVYSSISKYGIGGAVESQELVDGQSSPLPEIKTYKWRWVVLILFALNNLSLNYVWIMAAPVANVITCYYGVTDTMVNLLSTSYMIMYTLMAVPVSWAMHRYGLRVCAILASASSALGASIKVLGSGSSYFWIVLLGQFIASMSNSVFFGGAPLLSEVWFPNSERATATAIGAAIAPQIGIMLALGLSPIIVHSDLTDSVCNDSFYSTPKEEGDWRDLIYHRLIYYQGGVAAICIAVFIGTVLGFFNAPPTPPSVSRQLETTGNHEHDNSNPKQFIKAILLCLTNGYFFLFLVASGIIMATAGAVVSILNEIVLPYFPGRDEEIGYLGVSGQAASLVSMLTIGRILDHFKAFYLFNVLLSFSSAVAVAVFIIVIFFQPYFYILYIPIIGIGASLSSYQAVCYEYAVEMTYPLPESVSSSLMNIMSQIVSMVMILMVTPKLIKVASWTIVGLTALAAVLSFIIRPELKRVKVEESGTKEKLMNETKEKLLNGIKA